MRELPAGWFNVPLRDLTLPVTKVVPVDTGRERIRYIDIGSVDGERHALTDVQDISADGAPSRARQVVADGDTVFSTVRPYLEKIAYVDGSLDGEFASTGFSVLRPNPDLVPKYLFYFSISKAMLDQVLPLQKGVSYPAVLDKEIRSAVIPVPPLAEQRRIVEILEYYFSRIDAGRRELDATCLRVEKFRTALYRAVFSRYADAERPLAEAVQIENGQTPKGLVDALTGEPGASAVPFYKVGDMNGGDGRRMPAPRFFVDRTTASELGLHLRAPGVVLIPKRGGAIATNKKRILEKEAAFDLNTMGLRPNSGLSVEYLWRFLQGVDLGQIADGTAVPQINAKQIQEIQIPVVDANAQRRILAELAAKIEASEVLDQEVSRATVRAGALRRALLAAAFSGKLNGTASDVERAEEMAGG